MSYQAVIVKLASVRKLEGSDFLQLANCLGNQVVVGLDSKDDQVGVYFETDGQLGHDFTLRNNLYNKSALQKLGLLKDQTEFGFIDHNRRVRSQRFRGAKSDGLFLPLETLAWASDVSKLKEGDTFTELGGYLIAEKYYTKATRNALGQQTKVKRRESRYFPVHLDTKQFRFVANDIPEDAVLYLSEKIHGTQGRLANVLDPVNLPWYKALVNRFYKVFPDEAYAILNGSHRVILEKTTGEGWYGTNEFRYGVVKDLKLRKGESIFFEIVGFVKPGMPIMPPHKVDKQSLKEIKQQYGDYIHYKYGCPDGEQRLYVFRITQTNEDAHVVDLSWPQVVGRCQELGVPHVPLLIGPTTLTHLAHLYSCDGHEALRKAVESLVEGPSTLDHNQIREGVVIRIESSRGVSFVKDKSFSFKLLEGIVKEQEGYVDLEEIS